MASGCPLLDIKGVASTKTLEDMKFALFSRVFPTKLSGCLGALGPTPIGRYSPPLRGENINVPDGFLHDERCLARSRR